MRTVCFVVLLWVCATVGAAPPSCSTDEDCSLLGTCTGGSCVCDAGWKGSDCGEANLGAFNSTGLVSEEVSTWGGRVVVGEDGKYHLFYAEMANACPLILFMNVSRVAHAVSDDLYGNFTRVGTVVPVFAHNPQTIGPTPDGYYLIYYIGRPLGADTIINCEAGVPPECAKSGFCRGGTRPGNGAISMAWSKSVNGPWQSKVILPFDASGDEKAFNCINNNPSVTILPNGTAFMVYRANACEGGDGEALGIAVAPHWSGTYERRPKPFITPASGNGNNEDPFVWVDARGTFHVVAHNQGGGCVCGAGSHSCGAHLFSRDSYTWTFSRTPVYSGEVAMPDGDTRTFLTRQRPQLVFDDAMRPVQLWNGGSFEGNNPDLNMTTHTFSFAIQH